MLATTAFVVSEMTLTVSEPQFATKTSPFPASDAESTGPRPFVAGQYPGTSVLFRRTSVDAPYGVAEESVIREPARPGAGWTGPADSMRKFVRLETTPPKPIPLAKPKQTKTTATRVSFAPQLPPSSPTRPAIVNDCTGRNHLEPSARPRRPRGDRVLAMSHGHP